MLRISIAWLLVGCSAPAIRPAPTSPAQAASQAIPPELALETACPTQRDRATICRCLQDVMISSEHPELLPADEQQREREGTACNDVELDGGTPRGLVLIATFRPRMGTALYLLQSSDAGLRVVAKLGESFEPGELGISESLNVEAVTLQRRGGHEVTRVVLVHDRSDKDVGVNEITVSKMKYVVLCAGSPLACPLRIPVEYEGSHGALLIGDDDKGVQETSTKWAIDYAIDPDGTVVVKPGKDAPANLAGRYALWK